MDPRNTHVAHKNNVGLNTGSTDRLEHFDGMEHDLDEEGGPSAREYSHEMAEVSATVVTKFLTLHLQLQFSYFYCFFFSNMKILAWNVQGLAKKFTRDQLFVLVKKQCPDFLFLQETKIDSVRMISLANCLNYCNYVHIDRVGLAGGILFMWKDGISCEIQDVSNDMIHVVSKLNPSKPEVLITFMYGSTYFDKKKYQWDYLQRISENISQPWLVIGDLNFHMHEFSEDANFSVEDRYVQHKMNTCSLMDIGYTGKHYNWTSNSFGTCFQLIAKQQSTRKKLSHWNKIKFGDIDRNIDRLQAQLEAAQNNHNSVSQHENIVLLQKKLDDWFNIKTEFYKQKFGDTFITDTDQNTKYFHTLANRRMFRKKIDCLCDNDGSWIDDNVEIEDMLVSHFEQVSKTSNPRFTNITFDIIPTVITTHDNSFLNRPPTSDEIFQTIKNMNMNAWGPPGPDGFQPGL
ncbi:uncharacterized protein LOC113272651 [Papaver somniferum]|uniref:uncharacterized protein LOC113272651 n=1 Tax=Papaver somniferum TaxID=3469 RepID=UPI000E6F7A0E|nr:uncharacterized protein LOC113272651 [Papaver somniferum]